MLLTTCVFDLLACPLDAEREVDDETDELLTGNCTGESILEIA